MLIVLDGGLLPSIVQFTETVAVDGLFGAPVVSLLLLVALVRGRTFVIVP